MNNTFDFSQFSKQSKKGILVIYLKLLYKVLKAFWVLLFLFIQKFSELNESTFFYIYLGLGFLFLFFLIRAFLIYENFQFKVQNNHFILKQGILNKTNTSISFDRIQNINFKQNIIQQIINVHEVNIETAGSNKTEISIKALSFQKAKALKSQLSSYNSNILKEESIKEKPFLKISLLELLKVSLTENHLQSLLIFLALLLGLYQQLEQLFSGIGKDYLLNEYIEKSGNSFHKSVFVFIVLFILLVFIAILSSFVRVFLFHFNLTVFIKDQNFEIYQGLLTKKSIILKKDKIQSITVSTNPIKKILGISFITFKQAVSGEIGKKNKDKLIRIVGCKRTQVNKIKELLFNFSVVDHLEKKQVHVYLKKRMYFLSFILLLILNGALYLTFLDGLVFLGNVLLVPLFILFVSLIFNKRFYKISDDVLLVGSGFFDTHLTYLPFFKVQNIKMMQTFFQERNKVVDLVFQTASGEITLPCIEKSEAIKIYNYTLFKVESSTDLWM
ncbi:PH domain-containing protein [Polaribacter undariae]|uniref:PH domain-containing protein n=1 Tax=Polaribacter sejongensis TaxID=985043 RepID=A0AAJ1QVH6_9FLAO|nr:PH domain-containing protein [Polaribacter undariae]MDN3619043.1 PH domain-containing protein [Polaribacter undariae]UWD33129.1 PH domain-containing protein [Polaribacter undariae]